MTALWHMLWPDFDHIWPNIVADVICRRRPRLSSQHLAIRRHHHRVLVEHVEALRHTQDSLRLNKPTPSGSPRLGAVEALAGHVTPRPRPQAQTRGRGVTPTRPNPADRRDREEVTAWPDRFAPFPRDLSSPVPLAQRPLLQPRTVQEGRSPAVERVYDPSAHACHGRDATMTQTTIPRSWRDGDRGGGGCRLDGDDHRGASSSPTPRRAATSSPDRRPRTGRPVPARRCQHPRASSWAMSSISRWTAGPCPPRRIWRSTASISPPAPGVTRRG